MNYLRLALVMALLIGVLACPGQLLAQGVTTGGMTGIVANERDEPLVNAGIVVMHEPTGTQYFGLVGSEGRFDLPNMRIGGPYTATASHIGYGTQQQTDIYINLGQTVTLEFKMVEEAIEIKGIEVVAEKDIVLNSTRTGAATYLEPELVVQMPSIKRSTRDLFRLDPRNDGNYSFSGKNWLFNNISLDGSYFTNSFGLDDPAPGGQTDAEPVPFDAVEQVQVSVAPFDVREGGFTGAGINTVTKSGTNRFKASVYTFLRNESFIGNEVSGTEVIADPSLKYNQSGITFSGPIAQNKLFFFVNAEMERRDDPGTNFVADRDGNVEFGESRVRASIMDSIKNVMRDVYNYETGDYEDYINETNNNKLLAKLNWNISNNHNLVFRYNFLDAGRDLPPHPFVLSPGGTGRGPNENSLPFQNSGYQINNEINSFALELNSRTNRWANRFFTSYNRFRDFRDPFSEDFPTVEIAEDGVTYTTLGHEPFSIHNILDTDVWQFTDNFTYFLGKHALTGGANFETFTFYNSFNLFRHGLWFIPPQFGGTTFSSLDAFFDATNPESPNFVDFRSYITPDTEPFKGEDIEVGQLSFYGQDEFYASKNLKFTAGLRVDLPMYFNDMVDNPFSRALYCLDENGNEEIVDQSRLPDATPLLSPRLGFNWDVTGDRAMQVRGGTGIFTGRLPFVWIGNNISNPGPNPNLQSHMQSFDLNAMVEDFKWPQAWTTDVAVDKKLPWDLLGTIEVVYGKDINGIYVRNADLAQPTGTLPDGRNYYGGIGNNKLNDFAVVDGDTIGFGGGIYVIDNTDEGSNFNATIQLRKTFDSGLSTGLAYSFTDAKNTLKSTEIASVLWQGNPMQGNPNIAELSYSEFGNRHRIIGNANYRHEWSEGMATSVGLFMEFAEGNRFTYAGGNRYSFIYAGDVNGDGQAGNDLIYIPENQSDIILDAYTTDDGQTVTADEQWTALEAFIEQDDYLKANRGSIAERFGAVNPWFSNIDLRVLQDFSLHMRGNKHTFQFSFDALNLANLFNSDWGVRKAANAAATSPLELVRFDESGAPVFNYKGIATETYSEDPGEFSRWRIQTGFRYFFD